MAARELGFRYIDTGAMYRAATLIAMRAGLTATEAEKITLAVSSHEIALETGENGTLVYIDGEDVSAEIRTPELTVKIGPICEIPGVRKLLGRLQRKLGGEGGAVLEGRDIGTVIFPDAEVKIYLEASHQERARRRWREMTDKGMAVDYDEVLRDIEARDLRDRERELAPLRAAEDAVVIDTTDLSVAEVVQRVVRETLIRGSLSRPRTT